MKFALITVLALFAYATNAANLKQDAGLYWWKDMIYNLSLAFRKNPKFSVSITWYYWKYNFNIKKIKSVFLGIILQFSSFYIVTAGLDILLDRADADMPAKKLPKEVVDLIEYNAAQAGCQRSCTIGLSGIKVTVPWQGR